MKYQVVEKSNAEALAEAVCGLIEEGWSPLGGVAVAQQLCDASATEEVRDSGVCVLSDYGLVYAQAMVLGAPPAPAPPAACAGGCMDCG